MPLDPALPKNLLHLMEKRQGAGRRKQDGPTSVKESTAQPKLPASLERRKANRRKPKLAKPRTTR